MCVRARRKIRSSERERREMGEQHFLQDEPLGKLIESAFLRAHIGKVALAPFGKV